MKREILFIFFLFNILFLFAAEKKEKPSDVNPLNLTFQRLAVRRFIFSHLPYP
ncbi:MAG: hypothetical protein LBT25_00335 [Candidatus Symbiothrix sp.]|jgi:hypothetical protein|nr:hypothetical protein [Candidatus Symbiothrix sp.]